MLIKNQMMVVDAVVPEAFVWRANDPWMICVHWEGGMAISATLLLQYSTQSWTLLPGHVLRIALELGQVPGSGRALRVIVRSQSEEIVIQP